jgi:hypothetical protein
MKGTHAPFAQHGAPMNPQSTHAPSSHTLLAPHDCPSCVGSGSHSPLLQRWHAGQSDLHRFFFFFFFRFAATSRDEPPKADRSPAPPSVPSVVRRETSLSRRRAS